MRVRFMLRHGFTLRELVCVWAVIILLVLLLYPVVRSPRKATPHMVCLSNLKHLGSALRVYCLDYDQRLPPAVGAIQAGPAVLPALLYPYTRKLTAWRCPSDVPPEASFDGSPGDW